VSLDHKRLFLIDGIGAVVTASLLAFLLVPYESTFGMPSRVLYVLAAIAAGFAVYSFACYLKQPSNWPPFLRIIAIANLSYCVLTLILLFVYRSQITIIGVAYFAGEILIVSALALYELITARRAADR
jgi:hypothetical protein